MTEATVEEIMGKDWEFKKSFFKFDDVNKNFDYYLDELIKDEHFIEVFILLHQDFKEKIQKIIDYEFNNDADLTAFIGSLNLSKILTFTEMDIYKKFNTLRNVLAHKILAKQKENKDYTISSKVNWLNEIKNFRNKRHLIYKKLLEHIFRQVALKKIGNNLDNLGGVINAIIWEDGDVRSQIIKALNKPDEIKEIKQELKKKGHAYIEKLIKINLKNH